MVIHRSQICTVLMVFLLLAALMTACGNSSEEIQENFLSEENHWMLDLDLPEDVVIKNTFENGEEIFYKGNRIGGIFSVDVDERFLKDQMADQEKEDYIIDFYLDTVRSVLKIESKSLSSGDCKDRYGENALAWGQFLKYPKRNTERITAVLVRNDFGCSIVWAEEQESVFSSPYIDQLVKAAISAKL